MNCAELHAQLFEFIQGDLEVTVRVECEEHVIACPPCLVSIEHYRATVAFAKALPKCQKPLNPSFEARLRKLLG